MLQISTISFSLKYYVFKFNFIFNFSKYCFSDKFFISPFLEISTPFYRTITLKTKGQPVLEVQVKNKKFGLIGQTVATCFIDLREEVREGEHLTKWYDLLAGGQNAGKILLNITFEGLTKKVGFLG